MMQCNLALCAPSEPGVREHIYRDDTNEVLVYLNDVTQLYGICSVQIPGDPAWREFKSRRDALRIALNIAIKQAAKYGADNVLYDRTQFGYNDWDPAGEESK